MKFTEAFVREAFARKAARFLKYCCYFVLCFYLLSLVLSVIGRQSFTLHDRAGTHEHAIYAEENHAAHSRSLTVHTGDSIHVLAAPSGKVDFPVHLGLTLIYAAHILPMLLAFWFLGRVFSNVSQGQIFTEDNAACLLYYGLLQFSEGVFVPWIKLLLAFLTNLVAEGRIDLATGQDSLNMLFPSIAFLVAAYIIHYGVHLQDEVDHTL